jgi:hypothetical protein
LQGSPSFDLRHLLCLYVSLPTIGAGESQEDIRPRMSALFEAGIGGILDYAAEDDVDAKDGPASRSEPHDTVVARTYDYDTEAACDRHTSIFLRSIDAAAQGRGQGFAAIKARLPHRPTCPLLLSLV